MHLRKARDIHRVAGPDNTDQGLLKDSAATKAFWRQADDIGFAHGKALAFECVGGLVVTIGAHDHGGSTLMDFGRLAHQVDQRQKRFKELAPGAVFVSTDLVGVDWPGNGAMRFAQFDHPNQTLTRTEGIMSALARCGNMYTNAGI